MSNKIKKKYFFIIIVISGIISGITAGSFIALKHDLPQIRKLESFQPSSISKVYSREGELITEFFIEKRTPVLIKEIPENLIIALVTTEDRNFFNHSGIVLKGILRAVIKNALSGSYAEGASTLTQQLAKTLFLSPKKTIFRKIREAILALQLEKRYTKNEILQFYLNQIYFGSGAYGVSSAAEIYFGKKVEDLNLQECALLAAMPRSPSRYSPLVNPELAVKRRNLVLKLMFKRKKITSNQYINAKNSPLILNKRGKNKSKAPYFTQFIKKDLERITGGENLYKKGYKIYTTLSLDLQQTAENSIKSNLKKLAKTISRKGIDPDGLQSAIISIDVATGGILAMVGGRDFNETPFNRAAFAKRQPGSSFKPILYAYALDKGYEQNNLISDSPITFRGANGKSWTPQNYSKTFMGEITLRRALALSKNIPAIRMIEKMGAQNIANFACSLGIDSHLSPNLTLALGTSEITLLEIVSAYSVFADRGIRNKPFAIMRIEDKDGRLIYSEKPHKKQIVSRQTAALITDMLRGVILEGTGRRAKFLDRPIAGKTGTTDKYKDALFIGYSPSVATGVWTGFDSNRTMGRGVTGAMASLPVWIDIMKKSFEKYSVAYFDIPAGTEYVTVDPDSGVIKSKNSKGIKMLIRTK